ncbi:MAG: hypothetical protein OXF41_03770 [bacterium]|nr:hypothetical protein [bacterium]
MDDTFYRVEDATHGNRIVGLIEALDDRYLVLYTTLPVDQSDRWVRRVVDHNPWLDRLWLSSPILFELWKYVQRTTPSHRYVRLGFEREAWYETPDDLDVVDTTQVGEEGFSLSGAPITIRFSEQLSEATFNRFVELALKRRTSRFRIGGYVTRRGPTKVHLAGIDRHLWQPFLLEATSRQLLGGLPQGTCGNTIHRLVTNVQRYLDPRVDVWLGSEKYKVAVAESMAAA